LRLKALIVTVDHHGVAAMAKNIVAGCVVAALIFMIWLAYGQEHPECRHGHFISAIRHGHIISAVKQPCGSVDTQM
jgi:hypothetical protein